MIDESWEGHPQIKLVELILYRGSFPKPNIGKRSSKKAKKGGVAEESDDATDATDATDASFLESESEV